MATMAAITRKWGNSLGVTIPHEIVEEEQLQENQKVIIEIKHESNLKILRGLVKFKKTTQRIKDEMRTGWT